MFGPHMKPLVPLLLLFTGATASADWTKISDAAGNSPERFIDMTSIRQTGPMATMRRVWEMSNLAKGLSDKAASIKSYTEYDCKDRRVRVLEEDHYAELGAQGEKLGGAEPDSKLREWSDIGKGSVSEMIFNRVCPNDGS